MAGAKPEGVAELDAPEQDAPKPDGKGEQVVIPTVILERFEKIDKKLSGMKDKLGVVSSVNNLIVMVLFVLVIALVLAAIYGYTSAIKSETSSRDELTKSVNELRIQTEVLRQLQEQKSTTPVPATSTLETPQSP